MSIRHRALWLVLLWSAMLASSASAAPAASGFTDPQLRIEAGGHSGPIRRLSLGGSGWFVTASDDKTARIWSLAAPETPTRVLRVPSVPGVDGRIYGVAAHPSRPWVALAGLGVPRARVYLFDRDTGRMLRSFDAGGRDVRRLAWSPDGRWLYAALSGDPAFRVFDNDGRVVFEKILSAASYDLDVSPDGSRIAVSSIDARVSRFRLTDNGAAAPTVSEETPLTFRAGSRPAGVAFSPDGARLAVGFLDGVDDAGGRPRGDAWIEVYEAGSDRRLWRTGIDLLSVGNLRAVRFSADGRHVHAAGTGYRGDFDFLMIRLDAGSGRQTGELIVADDSVTDMAALPDGRMLYVCFDGSWGIVDGVKRVAQRPAAYATIRLARAVQASADGRRVAWTDARSTTPRVFALQQRVVDPSGDEPPAMAALDVGPLRWRLQRWENNFRPALDGTPVPLEEQDVSRTATALPGTDDIVLGTARTLRRLGKGAREVWRVDTQTEVRSIKDADGGRLLVTGMSDGSIRWWRASDGALLLSLFVTRDGRWVLWSDAGFYDAGGGGESLLGWHVNRDRDEGPDFFSIARFRERFNRPDVIDRILETGDLAQAVDMANAARSERSRREDLASGGPASAPVADIPAAAAVAEVRKTLPPTLYATGARELIGVEGQVEIRFSVRAEADNPARLIFVRVDGRPFDLQSVTLPAAQDGRQVGTLRLTLPRTARSLQLFAASDRSVSEPLDYEVRQPLAAPPPRPRLYVLAIGVSLYGKPEYSLNFPAKDATDFVRIVARQKGVLYEDVIVRTLLDGDARRDRILQEMRWLRDQVGPSDIGILFIAGHGINDARGRYFFIPHDGDAERLRATGIPEAEFRTTLATLRGKAYFFVDTCHAGNVIGKEIGDSAELRREVARIINDLSAPEHGVVVLASSSGRQLSQESTRWGNGAFTKAVVDGLGGQADQPRDGRITFLKLDHYVGDEVRRLTRGAQTPVALSPEGVRFEFPLALVP